MGRFFFLIAVLATLWLPALADENVVMEFRGSGSTTTGVFRVHDKWEVRWNARQVISVAVMATDGSIVAGAAGVLRGSLFVPLGGKYYFKVSDGTDGAPVPTDPAAEPQASWHLQVVELGKSVAATQALSVYTPYFMMPDAAVTPAPPAPPAPPPPVMTDAQTHAIVTIKGDNAQGFGFLMKSADGPCVVTHLSLLAANPNVTITTDTGAAITPLSVKASIDHDIAIFAIKDDHYSYLPPSTDATADVVAGDSVLIPNSDSGTISGEPGSVLTLSADRLEFVNMEPNAPIMSPFGMVSPAAEQGMGVIWNTSQGGLPIIHGKSGKALALLTVEKGIDLTDDIAKAWSANPAPGFARITPFYGLRLTSTSKWETIDLPRFLAETLFLKQFHLDTRALDSYLNGHKHHSEDGPPDNKFFLSNAKVRDASDTYKHFAGGADRNQRLEAARELSSDLISVADGDVATLQTPGLYDCNQLHVREELAYRKALRKELDDLSNNLSHLDTIALSR